MPYPTQLLAVALAAVAALAAGVAPAKAQPRFEVTPRVGGLFPLIDLGKNSTAGELDQVRIELGSAFTGGLTIQYNPPSWPASFRVAVDYTPLNTEVRAQPAACAVVTGPGCEKVVIDARYMVLNGDVLIRPVEVGESHLYFLGGLGIKRYDFADLVCPGDEVVCLLLDDFTRDHADVSIHLGLGINFRVGPARGQLEFADYMSRHRPGGTFSSGEVQQDLHLTVGVRLGVG